MGNGLWWWWHRQFVVTINQLQNAGTNGIYTVCENDPVFNLFNYLAGSPDVGGIWTDVNNIPVPNMFNPSISGSGTFIYTYTVLGTDALGCYSDTLVSVNVNPIPLINISASPDSICIGNTSVLLASGASFYNWQPHSTLNTNSGNSVTALPNTTTTYSVSGTDGNNCTASANKTIFVKIQDVRTRLNRLKK
mgnify:CR=1 FL=1